MKILSTETSFLGVLNSKFAIDIIDVPFLFLKRYFIFNITNSWRLFVSVVAEYCHLDQRCLGMIIEKKLIALIRREDIGEKKNEAEKMFFATSLPFVCLLIKANNIEMKNKKLTSTDISLVRL